MKAWTVKTIPRYPSRRWYALHWNGPERVSYLRDGRTMGAYKNRADAEKRADELNRERAIIAEAASLADTVAAGCE